MAVQTAGARRYAANATGLPGIDFLIMQRRPDRAVCSCGLGEPYAQCCGRWHGGADAPTAELLMRSRFTAFVVSDSAYLLRTWHPRTRPRALDLAGGPRFTRLEVLGVEGGGLFDTAGTVRFRAYFLDEGMPGVLAEESEFVRQDGRWFYLAPVSASAG